MNNEYTMLASSEECVPYRQKLGVVLGSINAAILLQQVIFNVGRSNYEGCFFKFFEPCDHYRYKPEDSWLEELDFSITKFQTALKKIGTRANSRQDIVDLRKSKKKEHCVIYYTDRNHVTWWYPNKIAISIVMREAAKLWEKRQETKLKYAERSMLSPLEDDTYTEDGFVVNKEVSSQNRFSSSPDKETSSRIHTEKTQIYKNNSPTVSYLNGFETYESQEADEARKVKIKTEEQKQNARYYANAKKMPIDFTLGDDIITEAQNLGYDLIDIEDENRKYINYYKNGKGQSKVSPDWNFNFLNIWLNRNYRNGDIKRYGRFYKNDANSERLAQLHELTKPGMFDDVTD